MPIEIEKAIKIATMAHEGQLDKNNKPYILHAIAVAMNFRYEKTKFIASILHDVVEDTNYTIDDLRKEGFSEEILTIINLVTRNSETYSEFISNIINSNNIDAIEVKIADMTDNMSRLESLDANKASYLRKRYESEIIKLKNAQKNIKKMNRRILK